MSLFFLRARVMACSRATHSLVLLSSKSIFHKTVLSSSSPCARFFSSTSTRYPLQYDMIINRPVQPQVSPTRRRLSKTESVPEPEEELGFDSWVDKKLSLDEETNLPSTTDIEMDKSKRKYYRKRRKRMYGSDSDDEHRKSEDGYVELKPEVVEFNRLHEREEKLYFHDTFAYPWEKDKHYKMVYQLEKKYFPDQCFDKAFLQPGESNANGKVKGRNKKVSNGKSEEKKDGVGDGEEDNKGLVFFEEDEIEQNASKDVKGGITEKKVEEFFKYLKKVPNKDADCGNGEPYLVCRSRELPPRWDGPHGTVVLVNKPKGAPRSIL